MVVKMAVPKVNKNLWEITTKDFIVSQICRLKACNFIKNKYVHLGFSRIFLKLWATFLWTSYLGTICISRWLLLPIITKSQFTFNPYVYRIHNPFQGKIPFLYPLKILGKLRFYFARRSHYGHIFWKNIFSLNF